MPFVPRKTRNRKRTYRIENGLDAIPFRTAFLSPPHGPPRSEKRSIGFIYIYISSSPLVLSSSSFSPSSRFDFTTDIATSVTRDNPSLSPLPPSFRLAPIRQTFIRDDKDTTTSFERRGKDNVDVRHTYRNVSPTLCPPSRHPYPYSVDLNRLDEILLYTTSNKIRKGKLNRGFLRSKLRDVLASSQTNQRTNDLERRNARFSVFFTFFFLSARGFFKTRSPFRTEEIEDARTER